MDRRRPRLACALAALLAGACAEDAPAGGAGAAPAGAPVPPPPSPVAGARLDPAWVAALPVDGPDLVDEAAARGLDYVNVSGEPDTPTILEANGAGVAALDLGPDGDPDLVLGQGLARLAAVVEGPGARLAVYANDGAGRFARAPSPPAEGWWNGLAAGDVDGDGDQDLAAGGYGQMLLCRQRDGALVAESDAPGGGLGAADAPPGSWIAPGEPRADGAAPPLWTTSLAFLDADQDGDLDLYVGRYLELDPLDPPRGEAGAGALAIPCRWKGADVFCGPRGLVPQPDRMLRNDGAGGFEDASAQWLPEHVAGYTLAVGACDVDGDGDVDLYVANDSSPNLMLVNEVRGAAGGFVDRALGAGVALSADGAPEAGMGVAFGDVDRDGLPDLALTNFSDEPTHLYLGRARGFDDATFRIGLHAESRRMLSWSAHLEDFDGDGRLELFTANGHVYPQADLPGTGTSHAQQDALWRIPAEGRVERVLPRRRDSLLALERGSRGAAVCDVDRDGAPDLVVTAVGAPAALGINRCAPDAPRLVLSLAGDPTRPGPDGRRSTRDALGARAVLVVDDSYALLKEVQTAIGYQSASAPELFLATGGAERYSALTILWPSGRVEELGGGAMRRRLFVEEGRGVVRAEDL